VTVSTLKKSLKQREDELAMKNNLIDALRQEKESEAKKASDLSTVAKELTDTDEKNKKLLKSVLRKDQITKELKTRMTIVEDENKNMVAVICNLKQKCKDLMQEYQKRDKEREKKIMDLEQLIQDVRNATDEKEDELDTLRKELGDLTREFQTTVSSKEATIRELERQLKLVKEQKDQDTNLLIQKIENQKQAIMEYIEKEKRREGDMIDHNQQVAYSSTTTEFSLPLTFLSASEYEDIMSTLKKPSLHVLKQQIL